MIDFSKSNYSCDNQLTFEDCLKEMEDYKWKTGQYIPLPIKEEFEYACDNKHS